MTASLRRLAFRIRIARDRRGQELIEYALLAGLLATVAVAILPEIHDSIRSIFAAVRRALNGAHHHHH